LIYFSNIQHFGTFKVPSKIQKNDQKHPFLTLFLPHFCHKLDQLFKVFGAYKRKFVPHFSKTAKISSISIKKTPSILVIKTKKRTD